MLAIEQQPEPIPQAPPPQSITVAELAARFVATYDPSRIKSRKGYIANVIPMVNARLRPYPLATLEAARVKKLDIVRYRDALRKKYKPTTVNVTFSYLHRIFAWAIESEILEGPNPCSNVERMRTTALDQKYSRAQCEKLLGPGADPMIATALLTGMRYGELRGLRWCDVRFELG